MAEMVPAEIRSGSTTYVHFERGRHDLYVPKELMRSPPLSCTWRYCVAKSHNNTVYFSNQQTQESVWILPDIYAKKDAAGGDGADGSEAAPMQVIGSVLSAAARQNRQETASTSSHTSASSADAVAPHQNLQGHSAASGTTVASPGPEEPSAAGRGGGVECHSAQAAAPASILVTSERKRAPTSTPSVREPDEVRSVNLTGAGSICGSSVRDRLAAWRANKEKSGSPLFNCSSTADSGSFLSQVHPVRTASAPNGEAAASSGPSTQVAASEAVRHLAPPLVSVGLHAVGAASVESLQRTSGAVASNSMEQSIYEEKRRQYLLANEALQQEKERLLRQQWLALEQARRLQETQAQEEAELLALVNQRKEVEMRRRQLEEQDFQRRVESVARLEGEQAARQAAAEVDRYVELRQLLENERKAQQQELRTYADTIAESLLKAARSNSSVTPDGQPVEVTAGGRRLSSESEEEFFKRRLREMMVLEDSPVEPKLVRANDASCGNESSVNAPGNRDDAGNNSSSNRPHLASREGAAPPPRARADGAAASPPAGGHGGAERKGAPGDNCLGTIAEGTETSQAHQSGGEVKYSAQFKYVGDIAGPASARIRHGEGTFYYDPGKRSYYRGQWRNDEMHGRGVMSLPHLAIEGEWRDNQLSGPSVFQTKHMKGTGHFANNGAEGNAVIEIDSNCTFAGPLKGNRTHTSGAISLSTGDHVEWVAIGSATAASGSPSPAGAKRGTGDCRVTFSNGDLYVGSVVNFRLHGRGAFRFIEGHEYVGEFADGFMSGKGTYRFANGNCYTGEMKKGMFHGRGVYDQKDMYVYDGEWFCGSMHGEGKVVFRNGDVWEGQFENDKRKVGAYTASALFQL